MGTAFMKHCGIYCTSCGEAKNFELKGNFDINIEFSEILNIEIDVLQGTKNIYKAINHLNKSDLIYCCGCGSIDIEFQDDVFESYKSSNGFEDILYDPCDVVFERDFVKSVCFDCMECICSKDNQIAKRLNRGEFERDHCDNCSMQNSHNYYNDIDVVKIHSEVNSGVR